MAVGEFENGLQVHSRRLPTFADLPELMLWLDLGPPPSANATAPT